jgi:hypothetical protein
MNSKRNSKRQYKSKTHKNLQRPSHRGGAIYSFDLTDKIGGLPARVPLNGTADGDCPATDTADLGFVNYGMTLVVVPGVDTDGLENPRLPASLLAKHANLNVILAGNSKNSKFIKGGSGVER